MTIRLCGKNPAERSMLNMVAANDANEARLVLRLSSASPATWAPIKKTIPRCLLLLLYMYCTQTRETVARRGVAHGYSKAMTPPSIILVVNCATLSLPAILLNGRQTLAASELPTDWTSRNTEPFCQLRTSQLFKRCDQQGE